MKKVFLFLVITVTLNVSAQSYFGYDTDNYNGVHGVTTNPANIVDARVQIDVNLFTVAGLFANDYVGLSLGNITQLADGSDFTDLNTFSSNANSVLANIEVLGPSFMFNINEKHSVGVITKARLVNNYNNVNGTFLESILDGFPVNDFAFEQNNLDGTTHIWSEVGVSYGRVLFYDYDQHYVKGGVTLKYLMGAGIAQGNSNSLSGNFNAASNQVNLNGDFSYLISYDEDQDSSEFLKNLSPGFGMDIGFIYEYRTRASRIADTDDNPRALNKYRAKIGVSLLDIGAIRYKDVVLDRYAVNGTVNADEIEEDFIDALDGNFTSVESEGDVTVALPTSLRVNIDYKIIPSVYANLDINQTILKKDSPYNNNGLNHISLTPRFETRIFSAYLPITYSALGKTSIGAGLKFGPAIMGSGSILSNLMSDNTQTANIYFGFKIPINHRR